MRHLSAFYEAESRFGGETMFSRPKNDIFSNKRPNTSKARRHSTHNKLTFFHPHLPSVLPHSPLPPAPHPSPNRTHTPARSSPLIALTYPRHTVQRLGLVDTVLCGVSPHVFSSCVFPFFPLPFQPLRETRFAMQEIPHSFCGESFQFLELSGSTLPFFF